MTTAAFPLNPFRPPLRRHLLVIAGIFAIVFGMPFVRWHFRWVRVDATIVDAQAVPVPPSAASRGNNATALVVFEYTFHGHPYTAGKPWETLFSMDIRAATATAARFKPGQHVRAYVDPDDPRRAFLLRHVGRKELIASTVWSLIYVLIVILISQRRRDEAGGSDMPHVSSRPAAEHHAAEQHAIERRVMAAIRRNERSGEPIPPELAGPVERLRNARQTTRTS